VDLHSTPDHVLLQAKAVPGLLSVNKTLLVALGGATWVDELRRYEMPGAELDEAGNQRTALIIERKRKR